MRLPVFVGSQIGKLRTVSEYERIPTSTNR